MYGELTVIVLFIMAGAPSRAPSSAPPTVGADLTLGTFEVAAVSCVDLLGVSNVYAVNDTTKRSLNIVTNAVTDSSVVLGAWDATASSVSPILTASTKSGVVGATKVTAPTLSDGVGVTATGGTLTATTITDGKTRISNGIVSATTLTDSAGFSTTGGTLNATTITDGKTRINNGTVTAITFTDGTATLSGGVLSGAQLAGQSVYIGTPNTAKSWCINVNPTNGKLQFQYSVDGKTYVTKQTMTG